MCSRSKYCSDSTRPRLGEQGQWPLDGIQAVCLEGARSEGVLRDRPRMSDGQPGAWGLGRSRRRSQLAGGHGLPLCTEGSGDLNKPFIRAASSTGSTGSTGAPDRRADGPPSLLGAAEWKGLCLQAGDRSQPGNSVCQCAWVQFLLPRRPNLHTGALWPWEPPGWGGLLTSLHGW